MLLFTEGVICDNRHQCVLPVNPVRDTANIVCNDGEVFDPSGSETGPAGRYKNLPRCWMISKGVWQAQSENHVPTNSSRTVDPGGRHN